MPSKRFFKQKSEEYKEIAKERIAILFDLAAKEFASGRENLPDKYVFLARKLAMKVNFSIPEKYKFSFCKKCLSYLVTGKNATVRTNSKTKAVELTCKKCSHVRRFGYSKTVKTAKM